jgi:hypothetical protein
MDSLPHDQIHGVFPDQDQAASVARVLYEEFMESQMELEAKKDKVTEKLKRVMSKMEKARNESMKMIKENPKDAQPHREKVAEYTHKIDELVQKLEMIEKSKKDLDNNQNLKEEKEYTLGVDKSRAQSPQYFISDSKGNKKYFATKAEAQKALDKKNAKNLEEGFFDRVKAKAKGVGAQLSTGVSNVGKAFAGKQVSDPKMAKNMAMLRQKASTFDKEVYDMIGDIEQLFPDEELEKNPQFKKMIDAYMQNLEKIATYNDHFTKK